MVCSIGLCLLVSWAFRQAVTKPCGVKPAQCGSRAAPWSELPPRFGGGMLCSLSEQGRIGGSILGIASGAHDAAGRPLPRTCRPGDLLTSSRCFLVSFLASWRLPNACFLVI